MAFKSSGDHSEKGALDKAASGDSVFKRTASTARRELPRPSRVFRCSIGGEHSEKGASKAISGVSVFKRATRHISKRRGCTKAAFWVSATERALFEDDEPTWATLKGLRRGEGVSAAFVCAGIGDVRLLKSDGTSAISAF